MKDLAPNIIRQRLLIEGSFATNVDETKIKKFFKELTHELNLRVYGRPVIHSTRGIGKETNQGFDAFIPLIDSGIALYVWENARFFSVVIYTCKIFDNKKTVAFTKRFFKAKRVVFQQF